MCDEDQAFPGVGRNHRDLKRGGDILPVSTVQGSGVAQVCAVSIIKVNLCR